jgi:hypothetical protein
MSISTSALPWRFLLPNVGCQGQGLFWDRRRKFRGATENHFPHGNSNI